MGCCLYVGMDDSNHAGEDIKGEINLAVFSFEHDDSIVRTFNNRRNYDLASQYMQNPRRDYRFTILTGERWRAGPLNLAYTAPLLINSFLREKSKLGIDSVKLYLDGYLDSKGRQYIREQFRHVPNFVVANFMKKRKNSNGRMCKGPRCPRVVYLADILAHRVLGNKLEECLMDSKYLPFQT